MANTHMEQHLLNCILELNRFSVDLPEDQFDQAVFAEINKLIAFDSAVIGSAAIVQNKVVPVAVSLFNLDGDFLELLEKYRHLDNSNFQAITQSGVTLMRSAEQTAIEFRTAVLDRYPVHYSMVTSIIDRRSGVAQGLSINRASTSQQFTESERLLKQALMPHFQEAYVQNRLNRAIDQLQGAAKANYSVLSSTTDGTIIAAASNAMALLVKAFPNWRGGRIPQELVELSQPLAVAIYERIFSNANIVVKALRTSKQIVWQVRLPTNVDKLSSRELQVAKAYSNGLSHKEIAKKLNTSPSTVGNQLTKVYEKLQVDNKAALAHLMDLFD
jgi:DNA-binding NarL/FixJ family response regulator